VTVLAAFIFVFVILFLRYLVVPVVLHAALAAYLGLQAG
jgi:hypothetical protein